MRLSSSAASILLFVSALFTACSLPDSTTLYSELSDEAKLEFISAETSKMLDRFGRTEGDEVPADGIKGIKGFVDGYVRRIRDERADFCSSQEWSKSDLASVLERVKRSAPDIIKAFRERDVDPTIGLYVAMIESEYCPCLQSPTGPLGLFQFTRSVGRRYGLQTERDASPDNPDERCSAPKSSKAAAQYVQFLIDYTNETFGSEYGKNSNGILLAVSAYNSGERSLKNNFSAVSEPGSEKPVNFWYLVANADKLSKQFQSENAKYVPRFLAAAIVGENPRAFGLTDLKPLSEH